MHVFVLLYSLHYKIYITFATSVVTEDDRSCMQNIPVFSRNCLYSAALSTFCPKKHLEEFQLIVSVENYKQQNIRTGQCIFRVWMEQE